MKQAKKRRMYERYQTLYLYLQETELENIAHIINQSEKTVKGYIGRMKRPGFQPSNILFSRNARSIN